MKCGLFTGAALLCAMDWLAGLSAGGLAWARAPETISALMATDIVRVLSIGASKAGGYLRLQEPCLLTCKSTPPGWACSLPMEPCPQVAEAGKGLEGKASSAESFNEFL